VPVEVRLEEENATKQAWHFEEKDGIITIGRDAAFCRVVIPSDNPRVGRQHCALEPVAGRYRVRVNQEDAVFLDGLRLDDNEQLVLGKNCHVRLGSKKDGPLLVVCTLLPGTATVAEQPAPGVAQKLRRLRTWFWRAAAVTIVLLAALTVALGINWANVRILAERQRRLEELTEQRQQSLADTAKRVQSSLMLIGHPDPSVGALASGFLISREKRLVATCAHVADLQSQLHFLYAVPNGRTETYEVDQVYYHPAVIRVSPQGARKRSVNPQDGQVEPFGPDVAVLHLKEGISIPPQVEEVQLATADDLKGLAGRPVGLLGYPGAETSFPGDGNRLSAEIRYGNIDRVISFNDYPKEDPQDINNQLVEYTMSTAPGSSGSPVFLENGHVVAINNSYQQFPTGNVQAYGIRIDCFDELLHHGQGKFIAPSMDVKGQMGPHVDNPPPLEEQAWKTTQELAQMLESFTAPLPGMSTRTTTAAQNNLDKDLQLADQAVKDAPDFPFVYIVRAKLDLEKYKRDYGNRFNVDEDLSDPKVQKDAEGAIGLLDLAKKDFQTARAKSSDFPRHAIPADRKCLEAKLYLCLIDYHETSLHPYLHSIQTQVPASDKEWLEAIRQLRKELPYPGIVSELDGILREPSLTRRLQALGWQIRARCHWTLPEVVKLDFQKSLEALPNSPDTYELWARNLEDWASYAKQQQQPQEEAHFQELAKKQRDAFGSVQAAIQTARAAEQEALRDKSRVVQDLLQAASSCKATGYTEPHCLASLARIGALKGDRDIAAQCAVLALQWSPDAVGRFNSKNEVYDVQRAWRLTPLAPQIREQ
jgi:hypothetical protein